jgi:isopenicillin-N epimerase
MPTGAPTDLRRRWALEPGVTYLNHGSYGACPTAVLEVQREWQLRLEAEPVRFLSRELDGHLAHARERLAAFVGADADDLGFVANATGAINAVVRSLRFEPGDELLTTDHEYNATINVLRHVAGGFGARVVVARLPVAPRSPDDVVDAITAAATDRTRIALVSHVTSPTALVFPIERIVRELTDRGVDVLVDGAHAPGMVDLGLDRLGAAWYAGNLHKWVCAPKGSGFLHARRDRQLIHPATISHGFNSPADGRTAFRHEFDWQGTLDPSPWLTVPTAIDVVGGMVDGGWPAIMRRQRELARAARDRLAPVLGVADGDVPPDEMLGAMAALPLPSLGPLAAAVRGSSPLDTDPLQDRLFAEHRIEVPITPWPVPSAEGPLPPRRMIRVSTPPYVTEADIDRLATALVELAGENPDGA